jgi:hypothetical protein
MDEPYSKGDDVLVRGRIQQVFVKEGLAEITFSDWWPRWSAVLVSLKQCAKLPAPPANDNPAAGAPAPAA